MKRLNDIQPARSRMIGFLVFSVLVHALVLIFWQVESYTVHDFSQPIPIEMADLPPQKEKERPQPKTKVKEPEIAETEDAKNREVDPNTHILSEHNQRAKEQRKAALTDDFRKKQGTGLPSHSKNVTPATGDPNEKGAEPGPGEEQTEAGKKAAGIKRNWKTMTLKDLGLNGKDGPAAATDDRLSDVQVGDATVLSTREFKFYSYYHRIKETLRQYWKPNVERKLAMLWSKGAKMKDAELVTQVLVMLDNKGKVTRITRVSSSGFEDLDEAAMEAFREAAPFPNPPAAMIDSDGLVRIRWDFILKTEASPQITFRGASPQRGMP